MAARTCDHLLPYPASFHVGEEDTGNEEDNPHNMSCVEAVVVQIDSIEEYEVREDNGIRLDQLSPPRLSAREVFSAP